MSDKDIDTEQFDPRLAAAYARHENKEQQYDEWAASYDADLVIIGIGIIVRQEDDFFPQTHLE